VVIDEKNNFFRLVGNERILTVEGKREISLFPFGIQ
jgi:hypothetical protein